MGEPKAGLLVALVAAAAAIVTPAAQAQRVRGTLTDSSTNEPVSGAVVSVLDSTGKFYARNIADDQGRFAVPRMRGAGTLHVVRIGYRPVDKAITERMATVKGTILADAYQLDGGSTFRFTLPLLAISS